MNCIGEKKGVFRHIRPKESRREDFHEAPTPHLPRMGQLGRSGSRGQTGKGSKSTIVSLS